LAFTQAIDVPSTLSRRFELEAQDAPEKHGHAPDRVPRSKLAAPLVGNPRAADHVPAFPSLLSDDKARPGPQFFCVLSRARADHF